MTVAAIRVVLARPAIGENIGFVARLIANFALADLVLVQPADGWQAGARQTAAMCLDVLDAARQLDDLGSALADCTHVFGFTARSGSERETRDSRDLGSGISGLGDDARVALVFGNEESGLSDDETAVCTRLYRVALPGMTSLNLSHAVAIALSDVARSEREPTPETHTVATVADKQRFAAYAREVLGAIDFKIDDPHFDGALRRLVSGAQVQARDLRILHRVMRHLEWLRESRD